jgi:hypothetical protein
MDIFINERSFHGQYFERSELESAFKEFLAMLRSLANLKNQVRVYRNEDPFRVYQVFRAEAVVKSINNLRDKSFARELISTLYNRLNTVDWTQRRVHLETDIFECDGDDVCNSSIAELAEMKLVDGEIYDLLLNFPKSKYEGKAALNVERNQVDACSLSCAESAASISSWLTSKGLRKLIYDRTSKIPPRDFETVLLDVPRFRRANRKYDGREMYFEPGTKRYWYVDNLHFGAAAHIEVFDRSGKHLGEASLEGELDVGRADPLKDITIS